MANSKVLQKLEEQLTCPLCLGIYREPRILTCHHVYCTECLQKLLDNADKGALPCPECRKKTEVAEGNVESLAPAFSINTFRDVFDKLQVERSVVRRQGSLRTTPSTAGERKSCRKHRSQSLDLYCQDCSVLVCRDCLLADKQHSGHNYTYVSKLGAERRKSFEGKLSKLTEVGERLTAAMKEVSQMKTAIDEQEATITQQTSEAIESLIEVLRSEKQRMLAELQEVMQRKHIVLSAQEQTLQAAHHELEQEKKLLTTIISTFTDQQVLQTWTETGLKIDGLTETLQMLSLSPLEEADVGGMNTVSPDTLREVSRESASLFYVVDVSKTQLTGEGWSFAQTSKVAQFQVQLVDVHGDPCVISQEVTVELRSLRNDLLTKADVTIIDPSCYDVTYMVETSGRYELTILVNNQHISCSPLSLRIMKPPHQIWAPFVEIATLQRPTGLAIVGEKLYVSEHGGNRVSVFNSKLEELRSIGYVPGPSEITVDHASNVYVCSIGDHKVRKYTADDTLVRTVGGEGNGRDEFNFPNGNCFYNDTLYVCDSDNNRIKLFDADFNLLNVYGKKGKGVGQFNFPCDIDIDSQGMIYVVDGHNHRIQVFNKNWEFQRTIGKKGKGPGELLQPVCIHIDNEQIFITEYENNRISVFTTSGQFLATFGERYLREPEGLAIDQDGFVYVSHSRQNVLVFC